MENASKALIIAGAILLAILIIGLGIFIYRHQQIRELNWHSIFWRIILLIHRKYILMVIPEEEKPCHWYWQSSRNYIQRHLCAALSGMVHMSRLWRWKRRYILWLAKATNTMDQNLLKRHTSRYMSFTKNRDYRNQRLINWWYWM